MESARVAKVPGSSFAWRRAASVALAAGLVLVAGWLALPAPAGAAVNTAPPASPVKLVFIHHSTGEAWLADGHGGLGDALRQNNYLSLIHI